MRIVVIPIKEFSESMRQSWLDIQASNPSLSGPCFSPELLISVGKFYHNIYVTVIYEGNGILGFLPFLKDQKLSVAKPIRFCDYQFIVGPKSRRWDIKKILKQSSLNAWDFNALVDFENMESMGGFEIGDAPRVDLYGGFEEYQSFLKQRNISFKSLMRNQRFLERDVGSIRFIPKCDDVEVLRRVFNWRNNRYGHNLSLSSWAAETLEYLYYLKNPSFSTVLSALYAGEDLLAASFCLRCQGVLYYLIPAFDPNFSKYSPGSLLLYYLISGLNTLQCNILDFGPGEEQYKRHFSNRTLPFIKGCIGATPLGYVIGHRHRLRAKIQSINWLYQGLRPTVRVVRKMMDSE